MEVTVLSSRLGASIAAMTASGSAGRAMSAASMCGGSSFVLFDSEMAFPIAYARTNLQRAGSRQALIRAPASQFRIPDTSRLGKRGGRASEMAYRGMQHLMKTRTEAQTPTRQP